MLAAADRSARRVRIAPMKRMGLLARFARSAIAVAPVLAGISGCGPESDEAKPGGDVMVLISFDEIAYVDAAITPQNMLARVQHQTRSGFLALGKIGVTVSARRQLEIDRAALRKDKVTVVDPATGITRSALRLRYHFESLAVAPRALLDKGDTSLALLHTLDDARLRDIRAICAEKADASAPLWSVFDGSLEACAQAVSNEQTEIEATRRQLTDPANEIVSAEFERRYMPVKVRVDVGRARSRSADDGGVASTSTGAAGSGSDLAIPPAANTPGGMYWPEEGVPAHVPPSLAQRDRDKRVREQLTQAEREEDDERQRAQRRLNRTLVTGPEQPRRDDELGGSGGYTAPSSYVLLYVAAIAAVVLLLVGKRQADKHR